MAKQRFIAEQIIHLLWNADIALAGGAAVKQVSRQLNIVDKIYYRGSRVCVAGQGGHADAVSRTG